MRKKRYSQDYAIPRNAVSHKGQNRLVLVTGKNIDYVGRPARAGQRAGCDIVRGFDYPRDMEILRRA
jgi:NAD(P)H-hydrate repair Nnr-like enzyme with NAD(P)H-hydrate dehydratase domain